MIKFLIDNVLNDKPYTKHDLCVILQAKDDDRQYLFKRAQEVKEKYIGKKVYFRGLIEYSNICAKNCYYCGIRRDNKLLERYTMTNDEVLEAAHFAYTNKYGSIVLQSGELSSHSYTQNITYLLHEIKKLSNGELGITLSLGEQSEETYRQWYDAGAHRYLLRIETSSKEHYEQIHPNDEQHRFENRLKTLHTLKKLNYQVGTGVMIGLPFQTYEHLAADLMFMKNFDIDMCGMGPYIEHKDTPMYNWKVDLLPLAERYDITLKMIALLRIMMKDINIASTTALQAIDPIGREKAITIGANIIMPNITPKKYRDKYFLYDNKPCADEEAEDCVRCLEMRIKFAGGEIGYNEWGDSKHFLNKKIHDSTD
ncbi:MAG: [FeFe] hydrogenase H-cluster radical SAM maturase HydE [Bacteroidales bacterium]|nr:[FeFe] hydrogenase H-cluster radical SAM maturase HydE [Bacteroidales bacterium]